MNLDALVWCETIAASGRMHLRRLSDSGPKYSGGSDTKTLCGMTPAWDLRGEVTEERILRDYDPEVYSHPCKRCVDALIGGGEGE